MTVTPVDEDQITVQFKNGQGEAEKGKGVWGEGGVDSPVVIDVSCFADGVAYMNMTFGNLNSAVMIKIKEIFLLEKLI